MHFYAKKTFPRFFNQNWSTKWLVFPQLTRRLVELKQNHWIVNHQCTFNSIFEFCQPVSKSTSYKFTSDKHFEHCSVDVLISMSFFHLTEAPRLKLCFSCHLRSCKLGRLCWWLVFLKDSVDGNRCRGLIWVRAITKVLTTSIFSDPKKSLEV